MRQRIYSHKSLCVRRVAHHTHHKFRILVRVTITRIILRAVSVVERNLQLVCIDCQRRQNSNLLIAATIKIQVAFTFVGRCTPTAIIGFDIRITTVLYTIPTIRHYVVSCRHSTLKVLSIGDRLQCAIGMESRSSPSTSTLFAHRTYISDIIRISRETRSRNLCQCSTLCLALVKRSISSKHHIIIAKHPRCYSPRNLCRVVGNLRNNRGCHIYAGFLADEYIIYGSSRIISRTVIIYPNKHQIIISRLGYSKIHIFSYPR